VKNALILVIICAAVAITACDDKATGPERSGHYFPNDVGSVWIYSVYDSLTQASYDMTVSIVDTVTMADTPVTVWVYEDGGDADTLFVSVAGDTVTFHNSDRTYLTGMYVFPLSVGEEWNCGQSCAWEYIVEERGDVDVPAGRFSNAYKIRGRLGGFNYYGRNSEWFAPHIGAVRVYRYSICTVCSPMIDVNETWKLISYNFPG
jgi:hypothetical protein